MQLRATTTKSYRGGSAPVSKTWPKLSASSRGERRQCCSARGGSEEAGPRYSEGSCIGLADGRAAAPLAKPGSLAPQRPPCRRVRLTGTANRVIGVVTWRKGFSHFTGEVPTRLRSPNEVRGTYKARPKGCSQARVQRRRSSPPLLRGYQQSQSRLVSRPTERQNLSQHPRGFRHMEPVSPPIAATHWPAVASCAATRRSMLRNSSPTVGAKEGCGSSVWETTAWRHNQQ